ncbi:MAG: hypothetical protein LBO20_04735 [Bifidobacteriaceae bacterium]|jgi:hypothetical protein|nr:hypothetical protein [Bifidobacteriaceae bacterium]
MPKTSLALLAAAAMALTACGSGDKSETGPPRNDDGTVVGLLVPAPLEPDSEPEGLDLKLTTQPSARPDWISAPWALATKPAKDSVEIRIVYVAGDTKCYGPAGFTVEETDTKVAIGAYTLKQPDSSACPSQPASAFKWGTIALGKPLGERALVHQGVATVYDGFDWERYKGERPTPPEPSTDPSESEEEPAE